MKTLISSVPSLQGLKFKKVKNPEICKNLLQFEDQHITLNHKIGILLVHPDQTEEVKKKKKKFSTSEARI